MGSVMIIQRSILCDKVLTSAHNSSSFNGEGNVQRNNILRNEEFHDSGTLLSKCPSIGYL